MARRRHTPEQVIKKLREAEVAMAEGGTVAEASRKIGVTEQTFYRWRAEFARYIRSIPARTGEPGWLFAQNCAIQVYPRAYGGTVNII